MAVVPEPNQQGGGKSQLGEIRRFVRPDATPLQAAAAWLSGNFGIYDERAMLEALRKDKRITVSDADIVEFFFTALGEPNWDPQLCLDTLAKRSERLKTDPND